MISRHTFITAIVLLAGLAAGYLLSREIISYLAISKKEKDLSELFEKHDGPVPGQGKLNLRIADMGGVGVLPDSAHWGSNYEHNQHYFEDVMLVGPPYMDTVALSREREKLDLYAGKMSAFGFNAIAMPLFLELVNFEGVGDGRQIYGEQSIYRSRHERLAEGFGQLMEVSSGHGLGTYLWTDMVALTPPLRDYFIRRFGSVDTENEALWEVYERAAEELFERFPLVEGIILRIGEAGTVYNKPGWDYTSELYVRTEKAVRLMLEAFLAAAEKYDRTIIFRTWSVGVGSIGDMHTSPETYERVLGDIRSDHLVVSTKFCAGDFYSWLPFNPTLYTGTQRRIMEIQAKREFEGFGSFPNYVAPLHQAALQSIGERNPRLEGAWVWTQYGGPLRAGPMIIYPFYGFNVINELNVYAVSRLLENPFLDLDSLTRSWVSGYFGPDSSLVGAVTDCMMASYGVMLQGLYISQFARYEVKALGLEPPPMLWIFEWDILSASSAVFSNIYYITRDHFQGVIDEGFNAVRGAVLLKELLLEVQEEVTLHREEYDQLVASVDYEIELFRLLDYYRQFFMHYYRWIETGNQGSGTAFRLAMGQFRAVADFHVEKYGGNLNTLGMDLDEAGRGITVAGHTFSAIRWARVWMVLTFFLLLMGIPGFIRPRGYRKFAASLFFDALFRSSLVSNLNSYHSEKRVAFLMVILAASGWVIFSSFTALWFPVVAGGMTLVGCFLLAVVFRGGRKLPGILITLLAPRILILSLFMVVVAVRGPMLFWYLLWTSDLFKTIFVSLLVMLIFRKYQIYIILGRKWGRRSTAGSAALVLLVTGVLWLLAGGWMMWTGVEKSLTVLNDELLLLPGGLSRIMGITTYLGIPANLPGMILLTASVLVLVSFLFHLLHRRILEE